MDRSGKKIREYPQAHVPQILTGRRPKNFLNNKNENQQTGRNLQAWSGRPPDGPAFGALVVLEDREIKGNMQRGCVAATAALRPWFLASICAVVSENPVALMDIGGNEIERSPVSRSISSEYQSWKSMHARCLDQKHKRYKYYGVEELRFAIAGRNSRTSCSTWAESRTPSSRSSATTSTAITNPVTANG